MSLDYLNGDGIPDCKVIKCEQCKGEGYFYDYSQLTEQDDEELIEKTICHCCDGEGFIPEY